MILDKYHYIKVEEAPPLNNAVIRAVKGTLSPSKLTRKFLIEVYWRKKARCVANGTPTFKGFITLAHTYAACLVKSGCRLFWTITALKNKIIIGTNAFAETPASKAPLDLKVDAAYINWCQDKTRIALPKDSKVKVQHAVQGHP